MRDYRSPFHSSEYIDMLADALHVAFDGKLADWQFAVDRGPGSWYWYSDNVPDVTIYASPFWTEADDISFQLSDDNGNCPEYGCLAVEFKPTGDVMRDALLYASLTLPMLAILTQRHHAALHPDEGSVHDASFAPVETEDERLARNRREACAKLTDEQIDSAIKHCRAGLDGGLLGKRDTEAVTIQLAALEAEKHAREHTSVRASLLDGAPVLATEHADGSLTESPLDDDEKIEGLIEVLFGFRDGTLVWAMTDDADDMDNEQLRTAIDRVCDVRDKAKRMPDDVRQMIDARLSELESESAERARGKVDDDDDFDDSDDDDADETFVQELVQMFNNADDDGPFSSEVRRCETFVDADVLTSDAGLRVVFVDGRVYDLTVQRARDER
jgi:hypothetical protein